MHVSFLDVGQGDSIFIETTDDKNILIDAGIRSAGEDVVSYLEDQDIGKLDMVIATHPHADHIGGLIPVLNHYKVDKFLDSGMDYDSQTYDKLMNIIDQKNINFEIPEAGEEFAFDNFDMTVLHADAHAHNANEASVAVKGEYDDISFMLPGDAESAAESSMVNSDFDLDSTIYKAGHHGSNTSSSSAFVNQVDPEETILSYGEDNSYGHPDDDVINRLDNIGSNLYSTAESGNIDVMTNGTIYNIEADTMDTSSEPEPKPEPEPSPEPKPDPKPDPEPDKPDVTYPININQASADELKELDGIGDVLSKRIVKHRNTHGPFKKKSDITDVKQIGPKTFEGIKSDIKL